MPSLCVHEQFEAAHSGRDPKIPSGNRSFLYNGSPGRRGLKLLFWGENDLWGTG